MKFSLLGICIWLFSILMCAPVAAQTKILTGIIKDRHSDERIPFASLKFRHFEAGRLSDSAGGFIFHLQEWPHDTLDITYVGYEDYQLIIDSVLLKQPNSNKLNVTVLLERAAYAKEVVVKRKIDRGLLMWRRIVRKKPLNDRYRFRNFSYELYNKLELDLKNINKDKCYDTKVNTNKYFK